MKYIRTKETEYGCIIDTEKYLKETGEECYIPENEIIKQANTIEDLCDKYILIDDVNFEKPYICDSLEEAKSLMDKGNTLYGAIWTDKGLIYVAKMNKKGELELL